MKTKEYILYCPRCNKENKPDSAILIRKYSVVALHLPYFMCGECRLICLDETVIRHTISKWRNSSSGAKDYSYKEIYKEMIKYMDEVVEYYCRTVGYKRAEFIRKLI